MWEYDFKGNKLVLKDMVEIILTHLDGDGDLFTEFEP